jgi:hypothetical protein
MPLSAPVCAESPNAETYAIGVRRCGYSPGMSEPLQNDPDRAGGLISDAQGEFVAQEPGGAFDPRSFREHVDRDDDVDAEPQTPVATPPVDDQRMSGPGEEIDKAG